jgi:hypothetical protein
MSQTISSYIFLIILLHYIYYSCRIQQFKIVTVCINFN